LNAALHPDLEAIIMKALAPKPADRYQSCDEMRVALDQFADAQSLRTSTTALADYMKQQFGTRPEPWLEEAAPDDAEIEITGSTPLDLVLELKLPDEPDEDDLSIPIETTVSEGIEPLTTPNGMVPLERPPEHHRPIKETLPLRALKIVPPARVTPPVMPAVGFPEDDEPEVSRAASSTSQVTLARRLVAQTLLIKRLWLVASASLLVIALVIFILVSRGSSAPSANAPALTPHEELDQRFVETQRAPAAPAAAPAPATTKPAASSKKTKKWDPDALFPN